MSKITKRWLNLDAYTSDSLTSEVVVMSPSGAGGPSDTVFSRINNLPVGLGDIVYPILLGKDANNANNAWLEVEDRIPSNNNPLTIPFRCSLSAVTVSLNRVASFNVRIFNLLVSNSTPILVVPSMGNTKVVVDKTTNLIFEQGDEIAIRMQRVNPSDNNIRDPQVTLWLRNIQ